MTFMETSASPATGFRPATPREILDSLLDPHLLLSPLRNTTGKITDFRINDANIAAALAAVGPGGAPALSVQERLARLKGPSGTPVALPSPDKSA